MSNLENADLLTNACAALEAYRDDERMLETEMTILQTRLELVREFIAKLSGKPRVRRGRPPAPKLVDPLGVLEMPQRVAGGISSNFPEPESAA